MHKDDPKIGNKFARNSIIFTFIILVLILVGYLYHQFSVSTVPPITKVPSQPATDTLVTSPTPPLDNNQTEPNKAAATKTKK